MKRYLDLISNYLVKRSIDCQASKSRNSISLWGLNINENSEIVLSGTTMSSLIKQYGSPLLVVNKDKLLYDAHSIHEAIQIAGSGSMVLYSYKTNCVPGILQVIHTAGIGAEVISPYELWLAERLNVPANMIIYNGVNKDDDSIKRAIKMGIFSINIDSLQEIDKIVSIAEKLNIKANVGIRLGFIEKSQFGLQVESGEALEACRIIVRFKKFLNLKCVHFCVTSNSRNSITHSHFARRTIKFCKSVQQETGLTIEYLDIGGGMGVPTSKNMTGLEYGLYRLFGCSPKAPDPEDFVEIKPFVNKIYRDISDLTSALNMATPKIIMEPGRFVTSRAEFLLSTVLSIKKKNNGTLFAITDAGRLSTTFPCDFEYHEIFKAHRTEGKRDLPYHIMGRICTSADWMAKNRVLPELSVGDILITMDAGAYFTSYSTNFSFPRPAIIMIDKNGQSEILRHAEYFDYLTYLDSNTLDNLHQT